MGRQKKNKQSREMELSTKRPKLNGGKKTIRYRFKIIVTKMLKELTDNYKKPNENYNSMKKEIETINKNQEEKKSQK